MTISLYRRVWAAVTKKKLAENPALVVAWLDAQDQQWRQLEGNPHSSTYANPLLYEIVAGPTYQDKKRFYDAATLLSSLDRSGAAPLIVGGTNLAIDIYRTSVEEDRTKLGAEIWARDPGSVLAMVDNYFQWEDAMVDITFKSRDPLGGDTQLSAAAKNNLEIFDSTFKATGIPTVGTPVEQMGAMLGPGWEDLGFRAACNEARAELGPDATPERFEAEVSAKLQTISLDAAKTAKIADRLDKALLKQTESERRAENEAEFQRGLAEFRGYGQLLGILIQVGGDPRSAVTVSSLFDNAATLYASYKTLSAVGAAFSMATFAGGLGAALSIYSALGNLGKSAGPDSTQVLLEAIRGLYDRVDELRKQVAELHQDIDAQFNELNLSVGIEFDGVNARLDDFLRRFSQLDRLIVQVEQERTLDLIAAQRIKLETIPTPELYGEALISLYTSATVAANNVVWTGAGVSAAKIAADLLVGDNIALLEKYPDLLPRLHAHWISLLRDPKTAAVMPAVIMTLPFEQLTLAYALPDELLVDLQGARSISPVVTSLATIDFAKLFKRTFLFPSLRPAAETQTEFGLARRLCLLEGLLQWPVRVSSILGKAEVAQFALAQFLDEVKKLFRLASAFPVGSAKAEQVPLAAATAISLGAVAAYSSTGERYYNLLPPPRRDLADQQPDLLGPGFLQPNRLPYLLPDPQLLPPNYEIPDDVSGVLELINLFGAYGLLGELELVTEAADNPCVFNLYFSDRLPTGPHPAEKAPTPRGSGYYSALFALRIKDYPAIGLNTPLAFFSIQDRRRIRDHFGVLKMIPFHPPLWVLEPSRKHFGAWFPADGGLRGEVSPGPYDDLAYNALSQFIKEAVAEPLGTGVLYQRFLEMRSTLYMQQISLVLCMGPSRERLPSLMREVFNTVRARRSVPHQGAATPMLPLEQLASIQDRWLDLVTVASCFGNESGNIEPLLRLLNQSTELLAAEESMSLAEASSWAKLTGPALARLLQLWRSDREPSAIQLLVIELGDAGELNVPDHLIAAELVSLGISSDGVATTPATQYPVPAPTGPALPLLPLTRQGLSEVAIMRAFVDSVVTQKGSTG